MHVCVCACMGVRMKGIVRSPLSHVILHGCGN